MPARLRHVRRQRALLLAKGLGTAERDDPRVEACVDVATLDRWIIAAAQVSALREVFDD